MSAHSVGHEPPDARVSALSGRTHWRTSWRRYDTGRRAATTPTDTNAPASPMTRHHGHVTDANQSHSNEGAFAPAYVVEIDPEFPADGRWPCGVFAFDRDGAIAPEFVSRWGAPRVICVTPAASPEWIGMFPSGGLGGLSGIFATPAPERICVVVDGLAYLVRVTAPGEGAVVAHDTVEQVSSVANPALLLLVRGIDLVALGIDGISWRSARLAVDDLRVIGTEPEGIRCVGDFLSGDLDVIVVDPATGRVVSGPRLVGPPWNPAE